MTTETKLASLTLRGTIEVHKTDDTIGAAYVVIVNLPTGWHQVGKFPTKFEAEGRAEEMRAYFETQMYHAARLAGTLSAR